MARRPAPLAPPRCSLITKQCLSSYTSNLFCEVCPDAARIPKGCRITCGWPLTIEHGKCAIAETCPCNQPDTPERKAALAEWRKGEKERKRNVTKAMRITESEVD